MCYVHNTDNVWTILFQDSTYCYHLQPVYINLRRSRDCLLLSVCVAVWVSLMVSYALHLLILGSCYAVHIKALSIWRREHLDNLEGTQPVAYIGWPIKIEHVKVGIFKRNRDL